MRFKLSSLNSCTALTLMALAGLGMAVAQAGPPGEKIQFSEPSNPTVASNLNRLDPRQSTFKEVEADLFKPFKLGQQFYNREGDLGVPLPSQIAPSAPDKRTQDLIEKRKNWAFADWNDLFPDPSMEEPSNDGLDGMEKKTVSLIERYYESLNQKHSPATNRLNTTGRFSQDFAGTNAFDTSGESFTPEGQFNKIMKQIFNPGSADGVDKSVVDFNRATLPPLTPDQILDQKKREEEFQRLLDPHRPVTSADQPGSGLQAQTAGINFTNQFTSELAHRSPISPSLGVTDPTANAFYSHVYDDPTALALGQTNNLLTPRPATPAPVFQLVPFDNLPKRKF